MGAADLGDRVVAVADEDALVEPGGAGALLGVEGAAGGGRVGGELVEIEAPDGAVTSAPVSPSPSRSATVAAASFRSRRYSIQRPPRSGRGTRATKLGITCCSSRRIIPPKSRASGSGEAISRRISCS